MSSGTFSIAQTWTVQAATLTANRPFQVVVPAAGASAALPVIIALHGFGGNGPNFLSQMMSGALSPFVSTHIFVAPTGYAGGGEASWNVVDEPSKAPDVGFIEAIVSFLARYSNVQASCVTLFGCSNGAAITHRVLIESADARITAAITDGSQLNVRQYRGGAFYRCGSHISRPV